MPTTSSLPWWQVGVLYNLYVRSFRDTNGDGVGDLTGVIEKLDYLAGTLGVDAIWLPGILESPWKEFGFDASDFCNVHPAMGTLETFDELVRQAHQRGLKVVVDFIPNHTSDQHPWFLESRSSRTNPKRDWYIWRNPQSDGTPPNNWLSLFGGPAWEWDEYTWQYYLHTFLKEQPDLNWRNPELQAAMFDTARFWLERGVDGFRVDAAHHLLKDPKLKNNPPNRDIRTIGTKRMAHEYQQHIYDRERPGLHKIYSELRSLLDEYSREKPRAMFAEVHVAGGWSEWAKYYGSSLNEFHYPFNNGFISIDWEARSVRKLVDEIEAALPAGAWPNAHLGNFDEWRVATRYGERAARAAAMLLFTLRGAPLIYYGEEIGMVNGAVPPEYEQDPFGKRVRLSRDPQRTPMQWDNGPHAGFSAHTTPHLWLPLAGNYRTHNVESELADPDSMLNLYRELIVCRKQNPALLTGSYQPLEGLPEPVFAYLRSEGRQCVLVVINFSPEPQRVPLPNLGCGHILVSTHAHDGPVYLPELRLEGDEGLTIELDEVDM